MQNPDGLILRNDVWYIQKTVRAGGNKRLLRESTGCSTASRAAAEAIRDRRVGEVTAELLNGPKVVERTFNEAAVQYVLGIERKGKDPERAVNDLNLVAPYIGDLPLSHVHQGALEAFEAAQRGVRRSSTVARAYRTVVAVLNNAARVLRDDNRPWLAQAVPKITAPNWGDKQPPYRLDWAEQDTLASQLAAHLQPMLLFDISTGAREQEVVGLEWSMHVDVPGLPEWAAWWIPPTIRKGNARKDASSQQGRYLICNATARSVVEAQVGKSDTWVFPGKDGNQVARMNNSGWRRAWRDAGLPTEGVKRGVHNLRHTFGERLEAAGVPWEYRKVLLGHEVGDVTALYSAPGLARLLEMAEKVTRATAPVLRPVTQITTHAQKRSGPEAAKVLI